MKKIFSFLAAVLLSVSMFAADWSTIDYLGDGAGGGLYSNKYKMSAPTSSGVVNIQQPGWEGVTGPGIYVTFPAAVTACSLDESSYAVQGAGMLVFLSAFTMKETTFTVTDGLATVHTIEVWYEDGEEPLPAGPALNPYAYAVNVEAGDNNTAVVSYSLNTNADTVYVVVYQDETVVKTVLADRVIGAHAVTVDMSDLADGLYTFGVKVLGTSVEAPTLESTSYNFWSPYGLAIDTNPASDNFGRILITESDTRSGGKASKYHSSGKGAGVYAFNPDFTPAYGGAVMTGRLTLTEFVNSTTASTDRAFAPHDVVISKDGRIFVSMLTEATAPVYELSQDLQTWTPVINGIYNENGQIMLDSTTFFAGLPASIDVKGEGADLKLLVYSCNHSGLAYAQSGYRLDEYALGTATSVTAAPTNIPAFSNGGYGLVASQTRIQYDNEGGYWFSASRGGNAGEPNLAHVKADGTRDYYTESTDFYGGFGLTFHEGVMYVGGNSGFIQRFTVDADSEGNLVLTSAGANIPTSNGRNVNSIAFDYAGNMFECSNSGEKFIAYAMPYSGVVETPVKGEYRVGEEPTPVVEAEHRTLTFVLFDSTTGDSSTSYSATSAPADVFDSISAPYVASITAAEKVYAARKNASSSDETPCGIKLGTNKLPGSFTFVVKDKLIDSISVSAAQYGAAETYIVVNGDTMHLTAGNKVFTTQTFPGARTITISSSTENYRAYVNEIKVYYQYVEPQMIANPLGEDGRFIVKYDCEAGAFAASNDMEIGETFTFAVDVTDSWLEAWLAAPASVEGAQRGLAINKWTSRGDLNGNTVRFKQISGNIWGMTANFAQQAQGAWLADAMQQDSVTVVYGQLFGFEYTADNAGASWWQWDGHNVETTQAVGTDGLFAFAPSTGRLDAAFTTAVMEGEMYGYSEAGYAAPCAKKAAYEFDHCLYNPANTTIDTFFKTGDLWVDETNVSTAVLAENGDVHVVIGDYKCAPWQAQVKLHTGLETLDPAKTYSFSFKMVANRNINNVITKMLDDAEMIYNPNITLAAGQEFVYSVEGLAGQVGNGVVVFDFGFAPANTVIDIYDIAICEEVQETAIENLWIIGECATAAWLPGASKQCTKVADGLFEVEETLTGKWFAFVYSIDNCTATETDWDVINAHRLGSNPSGAEVAIDGTATPITGKDGDYSFNVPAAGTYKFVVDVNAMTVTVTPVSGLEDVQTQKVIKVIENGQVIIIRDGVRYTVTGARVE